jgi:rhodanese-related sulfurtransferase
MIETSLNDPAKATEFFSNKIAFTTGPIEVDRMIKQHHDIVVVDVREEEDYTKGHVPAAISLPENRWPTHGGLRRDAINILYCYSQTCHLAARAAREFAAGGYLVMEMEGGFETWKENKLAVEK